MKHIIESLQAADALRVDSGPLLTGFGHEDDGSLTFTWTDVDDEFNEYVAACDVEKATVDGNIVTMINEQGEAIRVELFTLTPYPVHGLPDVRTLSGHISTLQKDYNLSEATLIHSLDDLVHECIGGHYASDVNNAGPAHQTYELMKHGYRSEVIQTLARLARTGTTTIEQMLQASSQ